MGGEAGRRAEISGTLSRGKWQDAPRDCAENEALASRVEMIRENIFLKRNKALHTDGPAASEDTFEAKVSLRTTLSSRHQ